MEPTHRCPFWLPISGWNGKLQEIGNGGWGGSITYATPFSGGMADALRRGYATASTDQGHVAAALDGTFSFGHREKLIDFAHRTVHEMTVHAKSIVKAYYDSAPRLSYWNGCSEGRTARLQGGPERTGTELSPGKGPGSEMGWAPTPEGRRRIVFLTDHFKYVVFKRHRITIRDRPRLIQRGAMRMAPSSRTHSPLK